ncbi:hypothetical protein ACNI3K_04665 [Demequina sp. SO4-13]|uniref:hypothetical protein n=1 Tax=Demequina sp. SO4-13 TaxID=3401027 RepID=UPI003AF6061E
MAEDQTRESRLPPGARRDSGVFMALLAATVLLYMMSIPIAFGVIGTSIAAAFFGLRALYRSRATSEITTFRWAMSSGVVLCGFAAFMGLTLVLFREPVQERQDCMARALTQAAESACDREYEEGVEQTVQDAFDRVGITRP